jgi:hypothetical protein
MGSRARRAGGEGHRFSLPAAWRPKSTRSATSNVFRRAHRSTDASPLVLHDSQANQVQDGFIVARAVGPFQKHRGLREPKPLSVPSVIGGVSL